MTTTTVVMMIMTMTMMMIMMIYAHIPVFITMMTISQGGTGSED